MMSYSTRIQQARDAGDPNECLSFAQSDLQAPLGNSDSSLYQKCFAVLSVEHYKLRFYHDNFG